MMIRKIFAIITSFILFCVSATTLFAQTTFVNDNAGMFSATTVNTLNSDIRNLYTYNRKGVYVYTTPSLQGGNIDTAAEQYFSSNSLNGVLIYISKNDKSLSIIVGSKTQAYFSSSQESAVRNQLLADFKSGNFDSGITSAVTTTENDLYQFHPSTSTQQQDVTRSNGTPWWGTFIIIILVIFGVILFFRFLANLFRPSMPYSGGYAGSPYGGSPVAPMGGGGFLSSLLGSFGGSIIGNSVFDWFSGRNGWNNPGNATPPMVDAGPTDYQNDSGQFDAGSVDNGSWGDSGGGTESSSGTDSGNW